MHTTVHTTFYYMHSAPCILHTTESGVVHCGTQSWESCGVLNHSSAEPFTPK